MPNTDTCLNALLMVADISAKHVVYVGDNSAAFQSGFECRNPSAKIISIDENALNCGDIEFKENKADLLILDVAKDPGVILSTLHARMDTTARAEVLVPNPSHWENIRALMLDTSRPDLGTAFTKSEFSKVAKQAGWHIQFIQPLIENRNESVKHAQAIARISKELEFNPQKAAQNLMPKWWLYRLSAQEQPAPISVKAIGIATKIDALSKIRVRQPLSAFASAHSAKTDIKIGSYDAVPDGEPGIFYTYRLHPENQERREHIDQKCRDGWLFIHDVDDHPAYLKGQKANDFWSIKAAHAVTVSTPGLVEVCKKWNPNVHLVPNQIYAASPRDTIAQQANEKPTLFFGALNREEEWKQQCNEVLDFLVSQKDDIGCYVIHEPSLHQALDGKADSTFFPTQTYEGFIDKLSQCDFALLPLFESEFNACKSDLKVIECLAHGVVPICSAYAAQQTTVPNEHLMIAKTPSDWVRNLAELAGDPDKVAKMKQAGYDYVTTHRMWSGHADRLADLYLSLIKDHAYLDQQRQDRLPR